MFKEAIKTYEELFDLSKNKEDEHTALQWLEVSLENALKSDDLIARACAYRGIGEVCATIGEH